MVDTQTQGFMEIEIVEARNLHSSNTPGGAPDTFVEVSNLDCARIDGCACDTLICSALLPTGACARTGAANKYKTENYVTELEGEDRHLPLRPVGVQEEVQYGSTE